jgi:hypothetical protein
MKLFFIGTTFSLNDDAFNERIFLKPFREKKKTIISLLMK